MVETIDRDAIAGRLSRLVQIPTVSAELDQRGSEPFDAFLRTLEELYPLVHQRLDHERVTDLGLLHRWPGADPDLDPVVLMAHFDVVPVDESDAWTHPPFGGHIEDGWVHGRGTLDDKGALVVLIEAVESLLAEGFTPPRDVYLVFGGNEETYGDAVVAIAETFQQRGIVPWLVLDEGGAVVDAPLPFVDGVAAMVGVGEKGLLTLRLTARGEGGHSSVPPQLTAVGRIARAVDRLTPGTFPPRTPRAISRMLGLFSEHVRGPARLLYRVLASAPPLTARLFARMGGEPAALVRTTVAATMSSGGQAANVLPSQASATLNLRIALGETVESTVRRVRRRISDAAVTIHVVEGSDPTAESPTDNAPFALLTAAVGVSHPEAATVPYIVMATTDARRFHRFSPNVYRFAPLRMSAQQRASIHGVDEKVEISELHAGVAFHRALLTGMGEHS